MKFKILTITLFSILVIGCSNEEIIEEQDANLVTSTESFNRFNCDPAWNAPISTPTFGDVLHYVYYSDNAADYGFGSGPTVTIEDIECVRQEYFKNYCGLYLRANQPSSMFEDVWIRRYSDCPPSVKDDVNTSSNTDPRVCVGSDCD